MPAHSISRKITGLPKSLVVFGDRPVARFKINATPVDTRCAAAFDRCISLLQITGSEIRLCPRVVTDLEPKLMAELIEAVRTFDSFTPDNA